MNTKGQPLPPVSKPGAIIHVQDVPPLQPPQDSGLSELELRLIPTALSGCQGICLFRTTFPPGGSNPRHVHPNADEFLYIIEGRAALGVNEGEEEGGPGTLHIIPAGTVHWLRNLDGEHTVEALGGYVGVPSRDAAGFIRVGDVTEEYRTLH